MSGSGARLAVASHRPAEMGEGPSAESTRTNDHLLYQAKDGVAPTRPPAKRIPWRTQRLNRFWSRPRKNSSSLNDKRHCGIRRRVGAGIGDMRIRVGLFWLRCHGKASSDNPILSVCRPAGKKHLREQATDSRHTGEDTNPHFSRKMRPKGQTDALAFTRAALLGVAPLTGRKAICFPGGEILGRAEPGP